MPESGREVQSAQRWSTVLRGGAGSISKSILLTYRAIWAGVRMYRLQHIFHTHTAWCVRGLESEILEQCRESDLKRFVGVWLLLAGPCAL